MLYSTVGGLTLLLVLLLWVRTLSSALANFVCRYIARPFIFLIGHFTSLFAFSLFEFGIILVVITAVVLLVLMIRALVHKKGAAVLKGLAVVLVCVMAVFDLYTLLVGFAYYRTPPPVPVSQREYEPQEVTAMVRYFAEDYNALAEKLPRDKSGNVIPPYTVHELSKLLQKEYKRLGSSYFYGYTPRSKAITNSWVLTLENITGITFVPLAEPTVNRDIPPSDLPVTMAHEMAHAKGVMREGDANFVAYYLLLSSNNDYLRYCAYFSVFYAALSAVNANTNKKADYFAISASMHPMISKESNNAYRFWTEKSAQPGLAGAINRFTERVSEFMNDIFLKSNGADNGSGSYSDKVTDGEISNPTPPTDTGEIFYDVTYSSVQKMFFAVYEERFQNSATEAF